MAHEILMPQLGLTMEEGTISRWLKREGDKVAAGENIVEIETDKLVTSVPSEFDGILLKIVAREGDEVPVKGLMAYIGAAGECVGSPSPAVPAAPAVEQKPAGETEVIVVGAGPGGYVCAIRLAQLGAQVTVVERAKLGGTCLNIGCIPTKSLLRSAVLFDDLRTRSNELGIHASDTSLDFAQVIAHKDSISQKLVGGIAGLFKGNKIKRIEGEAFFTAPGALSIRAADGSVSELKADAIVIATGSVNAMPDLPGLTGNPHVIDSTAALSLNALPASMIVLGGSVIGTELAYAYAAFGTKVTILESADQILPEMEPDLIRIAAKHFKKMGVDVQTKCTVTAVEQSENGVKVVGTDKKGNVVEFEAEKLLVAAGRCANVASLDPAAGGLNLKDGAILVDSQMRTNVPGVYAVGDCTAGNTRLAHAASTMGEVAAESIMGLTACYNEKTCPLCVYTDPQIASVGLTEAQCKEQGIAFKTGKFPMAANGKALIDNDGEGFIKVIVGEEYGEILGVHMIAPNATELIAAGALAIAGEFTVDELIHTIHAHPTVSEAIREAAMQAEKRAIHTGNK